ncbi:AAA family ATPase [Capnocytophaga granulosa]|jgi:hypothetical protein
MNQQLYIKNFGPIAQMDIPLKPLMVFIGESGSGKSAILKLISLLKWVHKQNNLRTFFVKAGIAKKKSDYSRLNSEALLKTSGLSEFIRKDTEIRFQIGDSLYQSKGKILTDTKLQGDLTLDKIAFVSENRGVLPDIYANKIPRNFKIPYYLEDTYNNFLTAFEQFDKKEFLIESTDLILFQKKGILPQFFVKDKSVGNTFEMHLENSSSGTKTALFPEIIVSYLTQKYDFGEVLTGAFNDFLMSKIQQMQQMGNMEAVKNINSAHFTTKTLSVFIEEPELSLYPSAQRRLINRLAKDCFSLDKELDRQVQLAFATHSPYIVNHLNLLIKAFDNSDTRFTNGAAINYEHLGVWKIDNGRLHDLKATDQHFIDVMDLSEDINEIYDNYNAING